MTDKTLFGEEFDQYAAEYDAALHQGLAATGEDKAYFAEGRVAWLAGRLRQMGERPALAVDFGCGTGSAAPYMFAHLGIESLIGLDVSSASVAAASAQHGSQRARFMQFQDYEPAGDAGLVFCNGVFHHIPLDGRAAAIDYVYRTLQPEGLFALWENNPWNPGTRYVMSRIPFDKHAIPLPPPETRRLLRAGGFEILGTDFMFIFPKALSWFRGLEPKLSRYPLGGQYQVLCRKP